MRKIDNKGPRKLTPSFEAHREVFSLTLMRTLPSQPLTILRAPWKYFGFIMTSENSPESSIQAPPWLQTPGYCVDCSLSYGKSVDFLRRLREPRRTPHVRKKSKEHPVRPCEVRASNYWPKTRLTAHSGDTCHGSKLEMAKISISRQKFPSQISLVERFW